MLKIYPEENNSKLKDEDFYDLDGLYDNEIFHSWKDFHNSSTFSKDETDSYNYFNLHKKPNNWNFKGMRPRENPVKINYKHFVLLMKGYRSALLEHKFNLKVAEIEECLV